MARKPADLSDLANRSNAALSKVMIAIVPLGVALLIAVVAYGAHEKRATQSVEARASAATFLVSGPPCANATEQDLDAAHLRPVRSVERWAVMLPIDGTSLIGVSAPVAWLIANERTRPGSVSLTANRNFVAGSNARNDGS